MPRHDHVHAPRPQQPARHERREGEAAASCVDDAHAVGRRPARDEQRVEKQHGDRVAPADAPAAQVQAAQLQHERPARARDQRAVVVLSGRCVDLERATLDSADVQRRKALEDSRCVSTCSSRPAVAAALHPRLSNYQQGAGRLAPGCESGHWQRHYAVASSVPLPSSSSHTSFSRVVSPSSPASSDYSYPSRPGRAWYTAALAASLAGMPSRVRCPSSGSAPLLSLEAR